MLPAVVLEGGLCLPCFDVSHDHCPISKTSGGDVSPVRRAGDRHEISFPLMTLMSTRLDVGHDEPPRRASGHNMVSVWSEHYRLDRATQRTEVEDLGLDARVEEHAVGLV